MDSKIKFKPNPKYRLMDQVREVLRYYHYAYSTEQSYCSWILQYIKFYGGKTHVKTTEIYTHVMKKDIDSVKSPLVNYDKFNCLRPFATPLA